MVCKKLMSVSFKSCHYTNIYIICFGWNKSFVTECTVIGPHRICFFPQPTGGGVQPEPGERIRRQKVCAEKDNPKSFIPWEWKYFHPGTQVSY